MCGRFVAMTDPDGIARFLVVDERDPVDLPPSYNVAPTDEIYIAVERDDHRRLETARWGLVPHWADDTRGAARHINARAETVADRPAFREAYARKRCLVPANGFYEWRAGPDGRKLPHFVHPAEGDLVAFAGLWSAWRDPQDPQAPWVVTCTIITTNANAVVARLHDRMPAVLQPADWDEWLAPDHPDPSSLRRLLVPAPDTALISHPVDPAVNSVRNNHPGLVEPVAEQLRFPD